MTDATRRGSIAGDAGADPPDSPSRLPASHPSAPLRSSLVADDLTTAAALCHTSLTPAVGEDWSIRAGDLAWSCRRTLDHLVDVLIFYAGHLATRSVERVPHLRDGDPDRSPDELLTGVTTTAAVLAEVARAAPADARGYHPAGMADAEGFLAMGCTEILVRTYDMAQGLGQPVRMPADLIARVLARLFPWADPAVDPWPAFLWATGRSALPDRDRLGPDWYWHCAPLEEWNGEIVKRTAPPRWT